MLGQPFATILARTDPFDLAQGVERYVRSLSGDQVRVVIRAARAHFNEAYRAEFSPLADQTDDERLKSAFAHALKSNLRAIPLFGPDFCEGVIAQVPGDRAIALGEEGYRFRQVRPAAFGIIALALLIGSAAVEHVWSNARANAQAPVVLATPMPIVMATPVPVAAAAPKPKPPPSRAPATSQPATPVRATPAPATPAAIAAAPAVEAPPVTATHAAAPVQRPRPHAARHTAPPGRGVKTIVLAGSTPSPSAEATPVDVTDMPSSYTDATPLPHEATAAPAQVNTNVDVPTPTPGPNRYWLHSTVQGTLKTLNNFNPFKHHHKGPDPTPSPRGPQPE